ncbi:unnamed protein product [Amoebophrya sp. A120]|nr:unnamed protein product [Amoebophrya sp. A120]|eukprot:GSA120T00023936001.1
MANFIFHLLFASLLVRLSSACSTNSYIYAQYNGVWKRALVKRIRNDGLFALEWSHDTMLCVDSSTGVNADNTYCVACAANCYVHPTQALAYRTPADYTAVCEAGAAAAASGDDSDEGLGTAAVAGIAIGGVVILALFAYGCHSMLRESRLDAQAGGLTERRKIEKGKSFAWGRGMTMELGSRLSMGRGGARGTKVAAEEKSGVSDNFGSSFKPGQKPPASPRGQQVSHRVDMPPSPRGGSPRTSHGHVPGPSPRGSTGMYPVQNYRTRTNASLALQILFPRQLCITNFISHAEEVCICIYTSAILLQRLWGFYDRNEAASKPARGFEAAGQSARRGSWTAGRRWWRGWSENQPWGADVSRIRSC